MYVFTICEILNVRICILCIYLHILKRRDTNLHINCFLNTLTLAITQLLSKIRLEDGGEKLQD